MFFRHATNDAFHWTIRFPNLSSISYLKDEPDINDLCIYMIIEQK